MFLILDHSSEESWMSQTDNYGTLLWMQEAEFHLSCMYNLGVLVGEFAKCTERPGSKCVNTVLPFSSPVTCEFVLFEPIICPYLTTTITHFIMEKIDVDLLFHCIPSKILLRFSFQGEKIQESRSGLGEND